MIRTRRNWWTSLLSSLLLLLSPLPPPTSAPFPPSDPRAVFNAFVIPWWYRVPRSFRSHVHRQFTGKPLSPEEEPPPSHVRARLSPLVQAWTGLYPNPQPASRRESPFSRTMRVLARNYRKNFGGGRGRFTTRRRKAAGPLWWWQRWLPLRRINWG